MDVKKDLGTDSTTYEDGIIKLAKILAKVSDWSKITKEEELYHYWRGEHKAELSEATEYLELHRKFYSREDEDSKNGLTIVDNLESYSSVMDRPYMSEGFNKFSEPYMPAWGKKRIGYKIYDIQHQEKEDRDLGESFRTVIGSE